MGRIGARNQGMHIFYNSSRQIRSIWWVAIFVLILAALTFPFILLSNKYKWELTLFHQAVIVVAASWICQLLRKRPLSEFAGQPNLAWGKNFLIGSLLGALLMLAPAFLLWITGLVSWKMNTVDTSSILSATGLFIAVAVAEEFLFRGFVFQRLIESIGTWGAQLLLAAYFLLIHANNPGMEGTIRIVASANIFLASIMFGLVFLRSGSLAMPIGLHFMANWVLGTLLGFGVSGDDQSGILKPVIDASAPPWLTGGDFGLEASIPGLICVIVTGAMLYRWNRKEK